jgi:Ca2+-transporting ATPase
MLPGALEAVVTRCTRYMALNKELMNFSKTAQTRLHEQSAEMSREGLRVIAVACGEDANNLTICGIVGLLDPLREGTIEAVRRITSTGTKVIMITGDSEETAVSVAKQAGIYDGTAKKVLSGREIEYLSRNDDNLANIIEEVVVCYRTSPRHKFLIVKALQSKGHCVAMTGDGKQA